MAFTLGGSVFTTAVEAGIAAFLAQPDGEDEAITSSLIDAGVEPWLAERLTQWLTLTFGRVVLSGAQLSEEFMDGKKTRQLSSDPVYVAAAERASRATREEIDVIGLRSAEVHAANDALNTGSRFEELMFSPIVLPRGLAPLEEGFGGVPDVREIFARFFEAHGHEVLRGALHSVRELSFDARVYPLMKPGLVQVQVDFTIWHPTLAVEPLLESFAGFGPTFEDAIMQAVSKFERGSVHPIIAALLDRNCCADQVTWERVEHPSGPFDLCIGSQLSLYSSEPANIDSLLDSLLDTFSEEELDRSVHGLRLFVFQQGELLEEVEVLLDNEPWTKGAKLASAHRWPRLNEKEIKGTRFFALLVPGE